MRGLKSADYHVMMQQILPLCLRHLLDKGPHMAIMKLSRVFKKICSKVVDSANMVSLKEDTALVLCLLEKEFPPSFFDPMTHLLIHLVEELEICGPVHTRWMYPMERYMKFLMGFVRNMARPEGSIAEGYALEEVLGFCTSYMQEFKSTSRRVWDDKEEPAMNDEVLEGNGRNRKMSTTFREWVHTFVVTNSGCCAPWRV